MIKVKFKGDLSETYNNQEASDKYAHNNLDMRLPNTPPKERGEPLEQPWGPAGYNAPLGQMAKRIRPELVYPNEYVTQEEYELDEDFLYESQLNEELIYEKKDRCYYQAKQKFDVFPSAYASGYIVRCRRGQIGRKRKKKIKLKEEWSEEYKDSINCDNPKGFSQRAHCQGREKNESLDLETVLSEIDAMLEEGTFDKEKSQGLHGWFARKGGKGKSRGWVDCNTCRTNPKTGRKTCKTCGRQSGEQRSKYPACRPTPSACTRRGTSQKRGPTRVSWGKKKQNEE